MRQLSLLLSLVLMACATTPLPPPMLEADLPPKGHLDPAPSEVATTSRASIPTVVATDPSGMFTAQATDDPMTARLVARSDTFAVIEISVRSAEGVSPPKIAAGTIRMAYAGPGWTVSPLRYDPYGSWARFEYVGDRTDCMDDGTACRSTRPVHGTVFVGRLTDAETPYVMTVRGEWHPSLDEEARPHFEAVLGTVRIEYR